MYFLHRFGYVEFANVEDAQNVFDSPENIELDGRVLYIDYGSDPKFDESERGKVIPNTYPHQEDSNTTRH